MLIIREREQEEPNQLEEDLSSNEPSIIEIRNNFESQQSEGYDLGDEPINSLPRDSNDDNEADSQSQVEARRKNNNQIIQITSSEDEQMSPKEQRKQGGYNDEEYEGSDNEDQSYVLKRGDREFCIQNGFSLISKYQSRFQKARE